MKRLRRLARWLVGRPRRAILLTFLRFAWCKLAAQRDDVAKDPQGYHDFPIARAERYVRSCERAIRRVKRL